MTSGVEEFDSNDFEVVDDMDAHNDGTIKGQDNETKTIGHYTETAGTRFTVTGKQMNTEAAIHYKREARWNDEKEELLAKNKFLENNLKEITEELTKNNNISENKVKDLVLKHEETESMVESERQRNVELSYEIEKIKAEADAKIILLENNLKEMTKNNNGNENKFEALVSKYKEIQSMVESERQRNVKLSHEIEKIKEATDENMKKKDDHIEELNKKFKGEEKKYRELVVINDKLEAENYCSGSKTRDTELMNTKLQEQINKIEKESNENMKKKDDHIEELIKKYKGEEKKYRELVVINDKLEAENYCSDSKTRDTELMNTKLQEQINKIEKENNENMKHINNCNAMLKADLEKAKKRQAIVDKKNDDLEEEIITVKLESKKYKEKYESSNNDHVIDIQQMANNLEKLTNECDVSENRCQELTRENQRLVNAEQKFRRDFAAEKIQLEQSLETVSKENEVLRQRNEHLQSPSSKVVESGITRVENRSNDFNKLMARIKDNPISNHGRPADVTGSNDDRKTMMTAQQSPVSKNWYETDRGQKILREITQGLKELFPSTELSRDVKSKDIEIQIKSDQNLPQLNARFPADFPDSPVLVIRGGQREMIKLEYANSFDDSSFANNVVAVLCQKYLRA